MEQAGVYFQQFIEVMKPTSIADIMAYGVFLLALIAAVTLPDGNSMAQNILYGTIVLALFDVTVGQDWYYLADITRAFPAYIARVAMFLLPFIAAGATRLKGKKGKFAPVLAALAGFLGLFYAVVGFLSAQSTGIFAPMFFK